MKINDVPFQLKDGRMAVLRNPNDEDVVGALEYLAKSAGETNFLMRYPEECAGYTLEREKKLFDNKKSSDYECMIGCVVNGNFVGNCEITFGTRIKNRHIGTIAIAVLEEYWGQGIGSKMLEEMIRAAKTKKEVTQLELEFIEGNERACHLYQKYGFRIVGVHPNAIMLKDGTLLNEYLMIKYLER